ncbi:MAG: hypothetical protein QGI83_16050, partial [Candidatus Latescibacteria bacterium]|nr:hypothetical protein [Candidatus Latescibacterota bacterium]
LSQPSGRGFVNRDILETLLGNLLECAAPGSHNAVETGRPEGFDREIEEIVDQLYAMILQSLIAVEEGGEDHETRAVHTAFALLCGMPRLKERALWNRFASLRDPAVWDAYVLEKNGFCYDKLADIDFNGAIDAAIEARDFERYKSFLNEHGLGFAFDYQMRLVTSTYPGWRVLFYHDVAFELTRSGPLRHDPSVCRVAVPLLPRAISELGGRYYQADIHPETQIGDANFLEHPHRGLTTGQTGVIGSGCVLYPCTLGGLTEKVRRRHPEIGDFAKIGTDATLLGPVVLGEGSSVGSGTEVYGYVLVGPDCQIGSSVVIGTVRTGPERPGTIQLGRGVRVGDGTIIENGMELGLTIPDAAVIPARSHLVNDGVGNPRAVGS